MDGFAASIFHLFRNFAPFPLPIGPLPFPPEATLRPWGFALILAFITTAGCCNLTVCSVVVTTACKSLYFLW